MNDSDRNGMEQTTITEAAVSEAAEINVFKLKRPFEANGKTFTELDLDLDKLSGTELEQIEREYSLRYKGDKQLTPMLDSRFRAAIVGRLNGFIGDDLGKVAASDYNKIQTIVLGKLLA